MASRPKVIHSDRPSPAHSPAASTTPTLRPKASMSSVAKVRRPPSPVKPLQSGATSAPLKRPPSALGRPTARLTPVSKGSLGLQSFDAFATNTVATNGVHASLSPASALSPTGSASSRQRRSSASSPSEETATTDTPAPPVRVKAKVTSLAKPQPLQPSFPPNLQPRSPIHSRSTSLASIRPPAAPSKPPKSPPTSPRNTVFPAVHTLPPTPTKKYARPQSPQSPPGSVLSSQSSISVITSRSSTSDSLDDGEDGEADMRRAGRTPVPLFQSMRVNGLPELPLGLDLPTNVDDMSASPTPTSPIRDRTRSAGDVDEDVRAEARTNRKIADLEITTASLQQLTTSLERTRHQQALEIRDLRRKLRETRLTLPPQTYESLKPTWEDDDELLDDDDEEELEKDPTWERIRGMVEDMLRVGRNAIEEGKEWLSSHEGKIAGHRRVLTAGELEDLERQRKETEPEQDSVVVEDEDSGEGEDDSNRHDPGQLLDGSPLPAEKHLEDDWPG